MSEQQSETVTVSGYGRKLCVLSEYVMRQAVCGYSAYGQRVCWMPPHARRPPCNWSRSEPTTSIGVMRR